MRRRVRRRWRGRIRCVVGRGYDVLVSDVLNGAMNRTRLALYASLNLSGSL